jgi:hypothetical protein
VSATTPLQLIFTLDYEVHGNGEGCPRELMVEPTRRMLDQFDRHGARLTILADVAEILKFEEYAAATGRDDFHARAIADQLRDAVRRGHDVQLHLHSSWFNARCENGRWVQDWSEYDFARLPVERLERYVRAGRDYLEALLRPVDPDYRCTGFRAANWSMQPSRNAMEVLRANGFVIESSVFKGGWRAGLVDFDYSGAPHPLLPWRASRDDVCREDPRSEIWELPIYAEQRWIGAFLSPNRLYRAWLQRQHPLPQGVAAAARGPVPVSPAPARRARSAWWHKQSWKADFNQCTGRQLIGALERAGRLVNGSVPGIAPFVLIGHSKLFTPANERSLEPFLRYAASRPERMRFATFRDASRLLRGPVVAAQAS